MTLQEQIAKIENQITECRQTMQSILNSVGAKIPEELQGVSLEAWSSERAAVTVLTEHLRRIESVANSAIAFININLS